MSKYIKHAEAEKMFLEEINKVGVVSFICMAEGRFDYYQLKLANGRTRYWKAKNGDFESRLNMIMSKEQFENT